MSGGCFDRRQEIPRLLAQFNYFPSWVQLPEYDLQCKQHLSSSSNKNDFLLFAKTKLETGDKEAAINTLEATAKFNWPETYRF